MYRVGRNKRASAEDIYRQCGTGDCPEDVKRKIEGDTWADRLLKWFGSFIYLGGLGIGTGKGSGGSLGYRPIGASTRPAPSNIPVRPAVPAEPIIPTDIFPVNTADPAGTAVIELTDLSIPDPSVIDIGTSTLSPGEIDIVSARDPLFDVTATSGHPNIITTADETVAVLDVQPIPPPKRFALDVQNTPTSTHLTVYSATTHPDPDINVFIDSQFDGDIIGDVEEIPLETFNTIQEMEIEEPGPKTSTPSQVFNRLAGRARQFYNRYTEQVLTKNPEFLGPVSRAVRFQFENPAYDPDVTLQFEEDVAELAAAPDIDFSNIRVLHRPQYSVTSDNLVRVSRLGVRSTMTTRSGLQLGQAVHFYQDISEIEPIDTIELQPINTSHISTTINALGDNTFINPVFEDSSYSDEDLIDEIVESFNNAHIVITSTNEEGDIIQIPTLPPGAPVKVFIDDYARAITIMYPHPSELPSVIQPAIETSITPALIIDLYSDDYSLHPSLLRRKRKRSDNF